MNQKHYNLLKKGVDTWNAWRKKHPDVIPDLIDANLGFADLSEAILYRANLNGAHLSCADLRCANLSRAGLRRANLSRADLSRADLSGADLHSTDFYCAKLSLTNLSYATLGGTDLTGANLSGTIFNDAHLWNTILAENDLSTVKGLIEIEHGGPSTIRLHTVKLPQDGSALHFLRGTGIPDELISWYRGTMMKPIQYHSCFISYKSFVDHLFPNIVDLLHT